VQRTEVYLADTIVFLERGVKRFVDILISSISLVLLSPFIVIITILIKLDSPGPAIYRQIRIGKDGKPFYLYKFRSMSVGGDDKEYMAYLKELIESDKGGLKKGCPYRKMAGDPRITRMGGFLRRFYLDELPQFWNILKGEMSLVGPRPHVQFEVNYYTTEQRRRLTVRPGATGLWQVDGKLECSFNELIALDLDYIDHWSLQEDARIVLKTMTLLGQNGEGFLARMVKRLLSRRATRRTGQDDAEAGEAAPFDLACLVAQEEEA
jgi:lipopolysaccharide/colanic/teichoic acid biosynthesis glycosyltransferase